VTEKARTAEEVAKIARMTRRKQEKLCFVLMPFTVNELDKSRYLDSMHWSEVYEGLIVPAVHEVGLYCERDDTDIGSRFIGENILRKIENADLVLCDLSSHNPNVFLELGWTMRADRPFVLIKDDLTTYTFDLNQQYTFNYTHALQPTILRKEIKALADVLRLTLNDTEQRYSVLRRMSISLSAIKAIKGGDLQTEILLDIQRKLSSMQYTSKTERMMQVKPEDFPWPQLLRRGMTILFEAQEAVRKFNVSPTQDEIVASLDKIAAKFGAQHSQEAQISLIDEDGMILYHDWEPLIGRLALAPGADGYDMYDEIRKYPHGVVAWADRASNVHRIPAIRWNIALFSYIEERNWKIVVELHQEID
jgi:hypothetical protein